MAQGVGNEVIYLFKYNFLYSSFYMEKVKYGFRRSKFYFKLVKIVK